MRTVVDVVELLRTTRNNLRKYYSHQFKFLALIVVPIRSPWAVLGSIDVMALTELMLSCNCDIRWLTNLSRRNPMCAASLNMMIIDEIFWWSKWYAIFDFCHTIFVTNISVFTQFHNSVLICATFPYHYQFCSPQNSFNIYRCLFAHSLLHFQITVRSYASVVTAHSWPSNAHSTQTRTVSCKYRRRAQSEFYKHDILFVSSCW